ncbi:MAG TPA: TlpA disulfide reductase family protein [Pseudonocardiaceae bacterium]|nr:TlpA disulfide reductase family protein [Pseudonocardiaceae bacterium]
MRPAVRWVMVTALLVFALAVALWPRADTPTATSAGAAQRAGAPANLDELRSRAALQPCPDATSSAIPAGGVLSGVELPCLGQPVMVDLGAALAGRPALLNLWGPLCQPCAQELPALAAYAAGTDAVPVLGVEVQRLPEGALEMLTALNVHYPSVSDPDGRLRAALGAPPVLPLSFVVSADGRVSQVNPPEVLRSPEQVRAVVQRYLDPGYREPGSQGPGSHGTVR